jgi:hypothetical protein
MNVIGAGFGRTGTLSLKAALEKLGFAPCYHMVTVFENAAHVPIWQAAADGEDVDWRALFTGFRAAVDWPVSRFYARLMDVYPEAKIVLTVRDPERWYESVQKTIRQASTQGPPETAPHRRMIEAVVWGGTFGGRFEDKAHAIRVYEEHDAQVERTVPRERLLRFEVRDGWGPLCRFLNVAAPDAPFPHLNDTASFLERMAARRAH